MMVWRYAIPALLLLVTVLVQVSVVQRIEFGDASPDLVVLVIVSIALLRGAVAGALYGFLGGLLLALASALLLGPHAILGTVIGYWAGRWGEALITDEHPVPPLIAAVCGTLAVQVGRPLIDFLALSSVTTTDGIWSTALVVALINALLAIPVYLLVHRVLGAADGMAASDQSVVET